MKKLALLLLFFALPARAQLVQPYWTDTLVFLPPGDFTNSVSMIIGANTAGGLTWILPASNGIANQVLSTTGATPAATLSWASVSSLIGDDTNFVATHPMSRTRNDVTGGEYPLVTFEHTSALDTSDLMQFLDPSGGLLLGITDEGNFKLTANQYQGAAGDLLSSNGADQAMSWVHPSTIAAGSLLNSTLTYDTSLSAGTYNNYAPLKNNFHYANNGSNAVFTGFAPNRTNGFLLSLYNQLNTANIALQNEDAGSKQADRIITGTGASVSLAGAQMAFLVYDTFYNASESPDTLGRWLLAGKWPVNYSDLAGTIQGGEMGGTGHYNDVLTWQGNGSQPAWKSGWVVLKSPSISCIGASGVVSPTTFAFPGAGTDEFIITNVVVIPIAVSGYGGANPDPQLAVGDVIGGAYPENNVIATFTMNSAGGTTNVADYPALNLVGGLAMDRVAGGTVIYTSIVTASTSTAYNVEVDVTAYHQAGP